MPYKKNSSRKFVAPLFLAEDRYWEDYMRPYLEKEDGALWRSIAQECKVLGIWVSTYGSDPT